MSHVLSSAAFESRNFIAFRNRLEVAWFLIQKRCCVKLRVFFCNGAGPFFVPWCREGVVGFFDTFGATTAALLVLLFSLLLLMLLCCCVCCFAAFHPVRLIPSDLSIPQVRVVGVLLPGLSSLASFL